MSKRIRKCPGDGHYTLSSICPVCGKETFNAHPPRYSPQDAYGKYRREIKDD
ncbi:RNA-protein complex protein Nop10 [Methanolacinia petrolearia]|uniref:RNA-protein complex protein Nop10 n=1 Tax=Methanolacinia petrolearia TaxID=54120 RepID=UPI003BA9586C